MSTILGNEETLLDLQSQWKYRNDENNDENNR